MKDRERWLDVVKGIGIFLMVLGHSGTSTEIRNWIYGFHMPLFFVVAGYMFDAEKWEKGAGALIKSRACAYLIPYVILFLINLVAWRTLECLSGRNAGHSVLTYALAGVYSHATAMPNCTPLWFLTCLFISYIFFWFLIQSGKKNGLFPCILAIVYLGILLVVCNLEKKLESRNCLGTLMWPW